MRTPEARPHGDKPNTKAPLTTGKKCSRTRLVGGHLARYLRRALSLSLTLIVWLFVLDFLIQFTHLHGDNTLAGGLLAVASILQGPIEKTIGFDARYHFPLSTVDFMPLIIFVVLLILRNRFDALLAWVEGAIRGVQKKVIPIYSVRSGSLPAIALNNLTPKALRGRGDDAHALRRKVMAIYSE